MKKGKKFPPNRYRDMAYAASNPMEIDKNVEVTQTIMLFTKGIKNELSPDMRIFAPVLSTLSRTPWSDPHQPPFALPGPRKTVL
jgi:hypothetical protein